MEVVVVQITQPALMYVIVLLILSVKIVKQVSYITFFLFYSVWLFENITKRECDN